MRAHSMLVPVMGLLCLCAPAAGKPEPDAETLRFVAACIRAYSWTAGFDRPEVAREMMRKGLEDRRNYFAARADAHASARYLRSLSPRAFRRRLDDALYLTTPRRTPRYCVAYAAAMRGVDVLENGARMNDAIREAKRPVAEWEDRLEEKVAVHYGYLRPDVVDIPARLADIYSRHPQDGVLRLILSPPCADGCLSECLTYTVSRLAADHTTAMLRAASGDISTLSCLAHRISGDVDPVGRERTRRTMRRIARAGGKLAPPARYCLAEMARWDAYAAVDHSGN